MGENQTPRPEISLGALGPRSTKQVYPNQDNIPASWRTTKSKQANKKNKNTQLHFQIESKGTRHMGHRQAMSHKLVHQLGRQSGACATVAKNQGTSKQNHWQLERDIRQTMIYCKVNQECNADKGPMFQEKECRDGKVCAMMCKALEPDSSSQGAPNGVVERRPPDNRRAEP